MPFLSPKKLFSFWKYLNFRSDFFVHIGKKFLTSQTQKQKVNHTKKFGQLMEYNIKKVFLEKS